MNVRRRIAAAVCLSAVVSLSVACVSVNEIGGSNNATPTTTTLPADVGAYGVDVTYGSVEVAVMSVASFDQSPNHVPRIKAVMRAENLSRSVQRNPDVQLVCDETANAGDWFLGSTWEPNVVLPVNAVSQGEVIVGFPLKGENPEYPVVKCSAAKLKVSISSTELEGVKTLLYPVDPDVITEAIERPRGPNLPLPPRGS